MSSCRLRAECMFRLVIPVFMSSAVVSMCCERFIPLLITTGFVPFPAAPKAIPRFLCNYPRFYLGYLHKNRGSNVRCVFWLVLPGQLSAGEGIDFSFDQAQG